MPGAGCCHPTCRCSAFRLQKAAMTESLTDRERRLGFTSMPAMMRPEPMRPDPPLDLGDVVRVVTGKPPLYSTIEQFDRCYAKLIEEAHAELARKMALPDVDLMKCSPGYRRYVEECVAAMMRRPVTEWPSWMQFKAEGLKPAERRLCVSYKTLSDPLTGRKTEVPVIAPE